MCDFDDDDEDHRATPHRLPRDGPRIISTDNIAFLNDIAAAGLLWDPEALFVRIEDMQARGYTNEDIINFLNDLRTHAK